MRIHHSSTLLKIDLFIGFIILTFAFVIFSADSLLWIPALFINNRFFDSDPIGFSSSYGRQLCDTSSPPRDTFFLF